MQIELWSIGKSNKAYVNQGMTLFSERINHYCSFQFKVIPPVKSMGKLAKKELKTKEAELVRSRLGDQHTLISLDERGKQVSSVDLAKIIQQQHYSPKTLVWLIGGAYGIEPSLLKQSEQIISLSKLTFPHQLVRLIMAEQLYRAFSIINHQPYHHL